LKYYNFTKGDFEEKFSELEKDVDKHLKLLMEAAPPQLPE